MKIVKSKRVKLSTGVELWLTEMPDGRVRLYHAGSKKKKNLVKTGRKIEVSTLTSSVIDLKFSGP